MGWQIPICQKMSQSFKKNMPEGICRIGVRQPRHFRYRLPCDKETKCERWVDQKVNLPKEQQNVVQKKAERRPPVRTGARRSTI